MLGGLGLWAPGLLTPLKCSLVPLEVMISQLEKSWCRLASLEGYSFLSLFLMPPILRISRTLDVGAHKANKETSSFSRETEEKSGMGCKAGVYKTQIYE